MPRSVLRSFALVITASFLVPTGARSASEPQTSGQVLAELQARGGSLQALYGEGTGTFRVLVAEPGKALAERAASDPETAARAFLRRYGSPFGVGDGDVSSLVFDRVQVDAAGGEHVLMLQQHRGVAVDGARLAVHMSDEFVTGVTGLFVPDLSVGTTPVISASAARGFAERSLGAGAHATATQLVVHRAGLDTDEVGAATLTFRVDVRKAAQLERMWIDARDGKVVARVALNEHARDRKIFVGSAAADGLSVRSEGQGPTLVSPVDNLYDFAGHVYDFYLRSFGRDSYDDAGHIMRSVYASAPWNCPNAWWDGATTNYCPLFDTDDVVAHEWAHAYTDYTHDLVYSCEPGALNESYSDIFGETVDLINGVDGRGGSNNAVPAPAGQRWLIGEDIPRVGPFRDMWAPQRYGQPARTTNFLDRCAEVHQNSGIPNHAFALLVDGGTYSNVTISGVGLTKAVNVYYLAMAGYQHPVTRFSEHALMLRAACDALVGAPLVDIATGAPSPALTSADCDQVSNATSSVGLNRWTAGIITGRITDAQTGSGIKTVCVEAWEQSGVEAIRIVASTADGTYTLTELAAGTYKVHASSCGMDSYEAQWYAGAADRGSATPILLAADAIVSGIDVALDPEVTGAPDDFSVTGLSVADDPSDHQRHVITVEVAYTGSLATGFISVNVCPKDVGECAMRDVPFTIGHGESQTFDLVLRTDGWDGDANVSAVISPDADPSDNARHTTHRMGDGPVGVGVLSSWE